MPGWDKLQIKLAALGGQAADLGALVELDRQHRPVTSGATGTYAGSHGQNVSAAFETETNGHVGAATASSADVGELNDAVYEAFNQTGPSFCKPGNATNRVPAPPARLLRYLSIRVVLEHHLLKRTVLGYELSKLPRTGLDRGRRAQVWLSELLEERSGPASFEPQPLAGGTAVWVTDAATPPHRGRSANDVARYMALPDLETSAKRTAEIGLVAVEYPCPGELFKPTIAQGFYIPCPFYPGEQTASHGTTLPLDDNYSISTDRTRPGAKEWVHAVTSVVLRSESTDSSECRVVWFDLFDCVRP